MARWLAFLLLFGSCAIAQSRIELLKDVERHYKSANSFEVKGSAAAPVPKTSWQVNYNFGTQAMQPTFIPLNVHSSTMQEIFIVGSPSKVRLDSNAKDAAPDGSFTTHPFGNYQRLTLRMIDATALGTEMIFIEGTNHLCEIVDVTYDTSPGFRPHSTVEHRRVWVDPKEFTILREQAVFDGLTWTANIKATFFNRPLSEQTLQALANAQKQPEDRPEWVGKPLPDLTVELLSGAFIHLTDLRGKPVLLDFWGSYCPPCKPATLHAQELAERYKQDGFKVLTFTQDSAEDAKLWATYNHVTLPIVLDRDKGTFASLDVNGIPEAVLFDAAGKVVKYWTGVGAPGEIDEAVASLLHPPKATAGAAQTMH